MQKKVLDVRPLKRKCNTQTHHTIGQKWRQNVVKGGKTGVSKQANHELGPAVRGRPQFVRDRRERKIERGRRGIDADDHRYTKKKILRKQMKKKLQEKREKSEK